MKIKDYMSIENKPESIFYRKYEDFVNDTATRSNQNSYKNDYDLKIKKKKKNTKPKKIKKYSDLPLKKRKKIIKHMEFPSDNNYYSKYGNLLDYYQ